MTTEAGRSQNLPDKRREISPYINHFVQPDSVIPNPASPQNWNRYSYVSNSPVNYNDPTGHTMSQGEGGGGYPTYCETHPGACDGNPDNDPSGSVLDPDIDLSDFQLPPDFEFTCLDSPQSVPDDYLILETPFTEHDACVFFFQGVDPTMCNPDNWAFLSDPSNPYSIPALLDLIYNGYNPTAIIGGVNAGGGVGVFTVVGAEGVVLFQDGKVQVRAFGYYGQGTGVGGAASGYGGVVFNLRDFESYKGPFMNYNLTTPIGAVSYFHDSNGWILEPGSVQGFSLGKGGGFSFSSTYTDFFMLGEP